MNIKSLNKLQKLLDQYYKVCKELEKPDITKDINNLKKLSIQKNKLETVAKLYESYLKYENKIKEAKELSNLEPELKDIVEQDLKISQKAQLKILQDIKLVLLAKNSNDINKVIMEIHGAAGGEEANVFAGNLFRMYSRYIEQKGWTLNIINARPSESGGFSLIVFKVTGKEAYKKLQFESGAHRVQRIPKTESKGRIHTSTATIAVLPEIKDIKININPKDLKIDTYRSSGAGGQHVNVTDSAVRITHLPTGIVVTSQDGRSQHSNKALAMEHLNLKLYNYEKEKQELARGDKRRAAIGTGSRSEKIRTYNYPQNRVTDHRLQQSWNCLNFIMEGDIEAIIKALIAENQKIKLEQMGDHLFDNL